MLLGEHKAWGYVLPIRESSGLQTDQCLIICGCGLTGTGIPEHIHLSSRWGISRVGGAQSLESKGDTGRQRRGRARREGKMCVRGHDPQCPAKNRGEEPLQGRYLYHYHLTNRKMGSAWWATSFNTKLTQMPCTSLQTPVLWQHHELRRLWTPNKSLSNGMLIKNESMLCMCDYGPVSVVRGQ